MAETGPLPASSASLATRIAALLRPHRVPVVHQGEHGECGLACLAMVAAAHGQVHDLAGLRRRVGAAGRGLSLAALLDQARRLGMAGRAVRLEPGELADLQRPAILHWNLDHWVVLVKVGRRGVRVHDPALGERDFGWPEVARRFTGVALELVPTGRFERADTRNRLRLADFLRQVEGWKRTAGALFALAACTQVLALLAPLHVQLVVDEAIVRADRDLVAILALGFAALALLRVIVGWLRDTVALRMATALGFQLTGNLFDHLVRLPLAWFGGRPLGDIASRFGSVEPVRALLSEGIVAALLDGLLVAGSLAMMLLWSPMLTAVVVAAVLLYALLRTLTLGTVRRRAEAVIAAGAAEDSHFLETLRTIATLRAAGAEPRRIAAWQELRVVTARARIEQSAFGLRIGNANALLFAAENLAVVWLGALAVVDGSLSVGMLYAFVAWKHQFTERMAALIDRGAGWRMLRLHLERLADIALEPAEVEPGTPGGLPAIPRAVHGRLGLQGVRHRHGEGEPWIIEHADVELAAGSLAVIVGASGAGKSTLLRILAGLLPPAAGTVRVDGEPLHAFGLADYRRAVATVLQDDALFGGTIIDNITLWDPLPDPDALQRVIRQAGLQAVLAGLPLRGDTLVGEGGALLSGGQRQRVLLARALYRKPRVLLLDEPLAHLDPVSAEAVLATIEGLRDVTRVVVSHDPAHGRSADVLLRVVDGHLRAWRAPPGA